MAEMSERNRWENELAQFQEVLINPTGQAIVIVGPERSGKTTLLRNMVMLGEKGEKFHFDGKIFHVGPNDNPNDILRDIGRWSRGTVAYLEVRSILDRLSSSVEEFGDLHRRVIGVDANPTQPIALKNWWLEIIPQLPEKVKFIFTQRPDDILITNKQFMGLPNVVRIDIEAPPASDDNINVPVRKYHQEFMLYLSRNKGYRNNSMIGEGSRQESGVLLYDVTLKDPESEKKLAVIETNETKEGKLYVREKAELIERAKSLGIPLYVLTEDALNSADIFGILRLTEKGDLEQIAIEDFPDYDELRRRMKTKTEVSGGKGGGDDRANILMENLTAFLINEKKFPRKSLNQSIYAEAPYIDLAVTHPNTDDILAIFSFFKPEIDAISFRKPSEILAKVHKVGFIGEYNPFVYRVHPSEESNEDFVILEVDDDGTSNKISYGDFLTYNQLLFASPLSDLWSLSGNLVLTS